MILVFNDFVKVISFQKVMFKSRQVLSVSLPDPVVLETEEQMLKREKNVCDVPKVDTLGEYKYDTGMSVEDVLPIVNIFPKVDTLGEYKYDTGMSVEDVLPIVNIKTLKG